MVLLRSKHLKRKKKLKLSKSHQQQFIYLLAEMLRNGFTIYESLTFMEKSSSFSTWTIHHIITTMEKGQSFDYGLDALGFSKETIIQLQLAQAHGNLVDTLTKLSQQMEAVTNQKRKLYKVITYPALLLLFLLVILFSMRQFLLPQLILNKTMQADNFGVQFIQKSPYFLLGSFIGLFFIYFVTKAILYRKKALEKASFFAKTPVFGSLYREYISAFFALEWGKLFYQGLEVRTVVQLMGETKCHSLMYELAEKTKAELTDGKTLYKQVEEYSFFTAELALIIQQGEIKGNLGKELIIYSELCWSRFFQKIEKMIQWIQPVIFLIVALLVVSIYAAMLLPIYGNMEGYL